MCSRQGIECCLTSICRRLCVSADEWAGQDNVSLVELPLSIEVIEEIAVKQIASRVDGMRLSPFTNKQVPLDCLSPAQKAAIEAVFYDPSGERQSYAQVARKFGVERATIHLHVKNALKLLRKRLT